MLAACIRWLAALGAALALCAPALAQESAGVKYDKLTGTLKKVHDSQSITLGYREASFPFSYLITKGQPPVGYAIELCLAIVEQIGNEVEEELQVKYAPVTPENRIAKLLAGEIDLECGSTTNNAERRKQVAFSPLTFVAGTKLLVRRESDWKSFRDMKGNTVVATRGTTNEAAVKDISEKQKLQVKLIAGADHEESFRLFADRQADALALDDVLIYGLLARTRTQAKYRVIGDYLSYDPYGIMFRKDDPYLADVVVRTFRNLAESRELRFIYDRWFRRRLPSGENLLLPISAQLLDNWSVLGLPDQ